MLQGRGGHRAKASLELMTAQPFRCQCKIQESTRATRSPPPITAWCSAPSSPSLVKNQGPHPGKRKGRLRSVFPSTECLMMPGEDGEEGPEPENSLRVVKGSHLGSEGSMVHRSVQSNPPTDICPFLSSLSRNIAGQSWGDHGLPWGDHVHSPWVRTEQPEPASHLASSLPLPPTVAGPLPSASRPSALDFL